ncbi:MAG: glycosyltransferase [Pirellula sp.]
MRILYVNGADSGGGAYRQAADLRDEMIRRGHDVMLAVRVKYSDDADVYTLGNDRSRNSWARFWLRSFGLDLENEKVEPHQFKRRRIAIAIGQPLRTLRVYQGYEDFSFPGTRTVLERAPRPPDIVHLWNLHAGYFDLRVLPELSRRVPVVIDLQDNWPFTGHCSYFRDCDRWKTGCKPCKYLNAPPEIRFDRANENWETKRGLYDRSQYYVKAPSQWTYDRIPDSILSRGMQELRLITNSCDTETFSPGDKNAARMQLNLPTDAIVLMYAAQSIENSFYKDWPTLRAAMDIIGQKQWSTRIVFMTVGGNETVEHRIGNVEMIGLPFVSDRNLLAQHYRASDVFLHAGIEEVWGLTMTEAMACGTPVIASAVGGIPEQVWDGKNGLLVPPRDPAAFARAIESLINNQQLRNELSQAASRIACDNFSVKLSTTKHLEYYEKILSDRKGAVPSHVDG